MALTIRTDPREKAQIQRELAQLFGSFGVPGRYQSERGRPTTAGNKR